MRRPRIAVLGAGSWGTALAVLLARNGVEVRLWGHLVADIERLRADRENRQFLPGVLFPAGLEPLSDLQAAVEDVDEVLLVVPSHAFRVVAEALAPLLVRGAAVSWATKGFAMPSSANCRRTQPICAWLPAPCSSRWTWLELSGISRSKSWTEDDRAERPDQSLWQPHGRRAAEPSHRQG